MDIVRLEDGQFVEHWGSWTSWGSCGSSVCFDGRP